jgi:hypothetical protein
MTADMMGKRFGHLLVVSVDRCGKRAACQCACARVVTVAVAALEAGTTRSCGCKPLAPEQTEAFRAEAAQRRRQRDRGWP